MIQHLAVFDLSLSDACIDVWFASLGVSMALGMALLLWILLDGRGDDEEDD